MILKIEFTKFRFDSKEFNKTLQKAVETQMRQAAREFVRAALARIPYRTGFLRGAFAPLLELLKIAAPAPPPGSTPLNSRGKPKILYREYYNKILKTPAAGAQFGTKPGEIFTVEGDRWFFNYSVLILYYRINDLYSGRSPSAPWGSMEAGREAFRNYMKNEGVKKLPKVTKFIMKTKVKLQGNRMYEETSESVRG